MKTMKKEILFKYNIRTICTVIDSINNATGETIKLRINSFINLLRDDPFLGPTFKTIFALNPFYRLSRKTNDLFPSIDLPNEPVAQIIFVINLMHFCSQDSRNSIFDFIFKLYGSGKYTSDFIKHVIEEPLKLLKTRLLNLDFFNWNEIESHISEILFPQHSFDYLTPHSLPDGSCIEKEKLVYLLKIFTSNKENINKIAVKLDEYVQNHNSYHPDIFFIQNFLSRVVKYGGREALSVIFNTCQNELIAPHILNADFELNKKKKKRQEHCSGL